MTSFDGGRTPFDIFDIADEFSQVVMVRKNELENHAIVLCHSINVRYACLLRHRIHVDVIFADNKHLNGSNL